MTMHHKFNNGIREDGTVEGHLVETFYQPCISIIRFDEGQCLRVVEDADAVNTETRIPYDLLEKLGFTICAVNPKRKK